MCLAWVAQTTADNALSRTQRLHPISVWERTDTSRTLYLEWKPVGAVANGAALTVTVGGVNITGVTVPDALAANDRVGLVLSMQVSAADAGSINRTANTIAGHVEVRVTHDGVIDTCWMRPSLTLSPIILQSAVQGGASAGSASITLPANFARYNRLEAAIWESVQDVVVFKDITVAVLVANPTLTIRDQTSARQNINIAWNAATRVLAAAQSDRFIYAVLD